MEAIDLVKINFSPDQLILLNVCLAFLMFGVALDIRLSDLKRVFTQPKAGAVGLTCQLLLLPILTVGMVYLFRPPTSMALGMILIGVCPGGNVSNFAVHLSGANAALSVSLTSIVTLGAIVITPLAFYFWSGFVPGIDVLPQNLSVNPIDMFKTVFVLILVPLSIGVYLNMQHENFANKIKRPIRILSILIFLSFVVFASLGNWDNIMAHIGKVFLIVLVHNSLALMMGYGVARLARLPAYDARAISIETGIQNSGLALILIFNFFDGLGGLAMIAAWWGIWHLISAFALASWWGRGSRGGARI